MYSAAPPNGTAPPPSGESSCSGRQRVLVFSHHPALVTSAKLSPKVTVHMAVCPLQNHSRRVFEWCRLLWLQVRHQPARRQRCLLTAVAPKPAGATPHSSRRVGLRRAATLQPRRRRCSLSRAAGRLLQPAATAGPRHPTGAPRLLRRRLAATAGPTDRGVHRGRRWLCSPTPGQVLTSPQGGCGRPSRHIAISPFGLHHRSPTEKLKQVLAKATLG